MCLKPRVIINRHYLKVCDNDSSKALSLFGNALDFYIKVDCGLCVECQTKRGMMWKTRLLDEYFYHIKHFSKDTVSFCTLTVAPEYYDWFCKNANKAVRLFLERYRKRYGCSFKHYITSEYGEKRGRLHLHMIGFRMLCNVVELRSIWKYGRVDMQTCKGPQGLTYVSGYITKVVHGGKKSKESVPFFIDKDKKTKVWVSPGFGLGYCLDQSNRDWHFSGRYPRFVRVRDNGSPFAIPRYYLSKIFSPIDLARRKRDFFTQSLELPKPPYKVRNSYFANLESYFLKLHSVGGAPVMLSPQFDKLSNSLKQIYYGK